MTEQTERPEIVEITLAAAFGYGKNVVRIPQAAAAGNALHAIEPEACSSRCASRPLEGVICGDSVDAAKSAAAMIAGEDLIAKISGVGSHTPLVNAVVGAEGATALCNDLKVAPAAERKAIGPGGESIAGSTATGECAGNWHALFRIELDESYGDVQAGSLNDLRRSDNIF